jgi:putative transposase
MTKTNESHYPVGMMCRALSVSRSGYHGWRHRPPSDRGQANQVLADAIKRVFEEEKGRSGSPRVTRRLRDEGVSAGRHLTARLMRDRPEGESGQETQGHHEQQAFIADRAEFIGAELRSG